MYGRASAIEARDAETALTRILGETGSLWTKHDIDLALLFAHPYFEADFEHLITQVRDVIGAHILIGCSGQGVIGKAREIETSPGVSLMVLTLPGADLRPLRITQGTLERLRRPEAWEEFTGLTGEDVNAWMIFADPFHLDCEGLLDQLTAAYPGVPIIGGLAAAGPQAQRTNLFLNDKVYTEGAVLLAIGGALTVRTVVAQGATPIGQSWTITEVEKNIIRAIGQQPAYEMLLQTLRGLPPEVQQQAQKNLLIGFAANEYQDEFGRGDFVIRNLLGADPNSGALAVGALPRVGQTVQFQMRDPVTADQDLKDLLDAAKQELGGREPVAALLCECNGRGAGLFGEPDHDAKVVAERLGGLPLVGYFCNGEFGPVGKRNYLHGYTASIALLVPSGDAQHEDSVPAE